MSISRDSTQEIPTDILSGQANAGGEIENPIHTLGLGWTEASLRRSKSRTDLNRTVETFHYDGVGHLESNDPDQIPAIAEIDHDLASLAGIEAQTLQEWWTVNSVDELDTLRKIQGGAQDNPSRIHNDLHQVERVGQQGYTWDVNGNLENQGPVQADDSVLAEVTYTHDWRDRLVQVDHGNTTTKLVVDPLGRLVAKVTQTGAGDATRVYLHDGDQVIAEYVQETGGTGYQLDRRKTWGRWIDDLVAEQVDMDHDGNLDNTLYPVTDMLGSVQLLTDASGSVVERIEYDSDGTPHFWSADTTVPTVTRVAWTGDGNRPIGDTVEADVFEIGFDEWIDEASVAGAAADLTEDGGSAIDLVVALDPGGRGLILSGASVTGGTGYTLHLGGVEDRAGNEMLALDLAVNVADPAGYEVVSDDVGSVLLAAVDAADGIVLVFDEPVTAADLGVALTVERSGVSVDGTTTRVNANVVKWTADDPLMWMVAGDYSVTSVDLVDTAASGNSASTAALPVEFRHLATDAESPLVVFEAAGDSVPRGESEYGVTSLFQGRGWHDELGLYYFRARWYSPEAGIFSERDPLGDVDGSNQYQPFRFNGENLLDSFGEKAYLVFRQFNGAILKYGYPLIGHVYLAFDEGGLDDVAAWQRTVKSMPEPDPRFDRDQDSDSETFSFHPWEVGGVRVPGSGYVSNSGQSYFFTLYTEGSYIGYNDDIDQETFQRLRKWGGDPAFHPGRTDGAIWEIDLTQNQQEVLYHLAIQSRDLNNRSPQANDHGWYTLNANNCGTWSRWMIERVGLEFPTSASALNAGGVGIGGIMEKTQIPRLASMASAMIGKQIKSQMEFWDSRSRKLNKGRKGVTVPLWQAPFGGTPW